MGNEIKRNGGDKGQRSAGIFSIFWFTGLDVFFEMYECSVTGI